MSVKGTLEAGKFDALPTEISLGLQSDETEYAELIFPGLTLVNLEGNGSKKGGFLTASRQLTMRREVKPGEEFGLIAGEGPYVLFPPDQIENFNAEVAKLDIVHKVAFRFRGY